MKLQAGMAFECELDSIGVKGRIIENSGKFALRYKNGWDVDKIFTLVHGVNKISYLVSIIPTFKIIPITLDLLQVGDEVTNCDKYKYTVLSRSNDLVHLSINNNPNKAMADHSTILELEDNGHNVIQPKWEEETKDISENIKGLIKAREILDEFIDDNILI